MRARSPVQRSAPTCMLSQLRARRMASAATVLLARLGGMTVVFLNGLTWECVTSSCSMAYPQIVRR
ncbi:hypothetical protein ACS96_27505 [Pseudomonas aeruginosa]|nr:hypothetical protein ACS96_27505 [Pseudomonas aeruginosa]